MLETSIVPGEVLLEEGTLILNEGRKVITLRVNNTGDRPIQVGSHTHFFEVNSALSFQRSDAYGLRLDIPSGTALRFEPGEGKEVHLIAFGGARRAFGMNALVMGNLDEFREQAIKHVESAGNAP